jgi:hypothetical protein
MAREAGAGGTPSLATDGVPEPGILGSCRRGAAAGLRRTSRVIAPVVVLALLPGLALTGVGLGAGRGWPVDRSWGLPPVLLWPVGFYVFCLLCGGLLGAFRGLVGALYRSAVSASRRASWATTARRSFPSVQWVFRLLGSIGTRPPRRWLRRATWAVVGLVFVCSFVAGMVLGRRVDRRMQDAVAAAGRDDPFWRLDDLLAHRAAVPDAENSALVVADVVKWLPKGWPALPNVPGRPAPRPTRFEETMGRLLKLAENLRLDEEAAGSLRDEMVAHAAAVRLGRTVADYRRGRRVLTIGETVFDTPLPGTQAARTAAQLLAADAAIRVHDGDADGALDSCRALLGIARSIGDEPFLISQIVRVAIGREALRSARRVLGQGEPSDAALARLQAAVVDERAQPLFVVGTKGERAMLAEAIRRVAEGELAASRLGGIDGLTALGQSGDAPVSWERLALDHQRALAIEWMNRAVAIARRPVAERPLLWRTWESEIIARGRQPEIRFLTFRLLPSSLPAVVFVDPVFARYETELGAMAILLAAERHRLRTGDWPASIDAIDPAILASAPRDPFTGDAFLMLRQDGQLRVYSPGPDLEDDGGAFDTPPRMPGDGPGPDDIGVRAWDVPFRPRG